MGLASASAGAPPPKALASFAETKDQVTASTRPCAASVRRAARARFCSGVDDRRRHPFRAREGSGWNALHPCDAQNFLDEIGLALNVRPPGRNGDARARLSGVLDGKAEPLQNVLGLRRRDVDAREPLGFAKREIDAPPLAGRGPREENLGRLAATELHDEARRQLEAGKREGRIDAALETIARVGHDAELATAFGDICRVPERRLDEHVGRALVAARGLAAHEARKRLRSRLVADRDEALVERIGAAVERKQLLARAGAPNGEIASDLLGVEDMQRPAAVEGEEIGHIDQRVDRAQSDRPEPVLKPGGARAVLDAAHEPQPEERRKMRVFRREVERHLDGAREFPLDGFWRARLEPADAGGGEIARDPGDARGVRPISASD